MERPTTVFFLPNPEICGGIPCPAARPSSTARRRRAWCCVQKGRASLSRRSVHHRLELASPGKEAPPTVASRGPPWQASAPPECRPCCARFPPRALRNTPGGRPESSWGNFSRRGPRCLLCRANSARSSPGETRRKWGTSVSQKGSRKTCVSTH